MVSEEARSIDIPQCPLCGKPHSYALRVVSSTVSNYMPDDASGPLRETSFVRLFACAISKEMFQATVSLAPAAGSRIKDVEVVGPKGRPDG